ncbi:hypothetical protein LNK20_21780, partial [Bacillus safensis]|nr:hypothetical protein [Bacillus safensis]
TPVWRDIDAGTVETNYQRFARAVADGAQLEPGFRHAANLQRVLDHAMIVDRPLPEVVAG